MTELVWVALISAGAAVATALLTQYLAMSAARRQADRSERLASLQWQRTEATRQLAYRTAQGREFWALALQSRRSMLARVRQGPGAGDLLAADFAAQAYAVALFGLPDAAPAAKDFYQASADLEAQIGQESDLQTLRVLAAIQLWSDAFERLEAALLQGPAPDAAQASGR